MSGTVLHSNNEINYLVSLRLDEEQFVSNLVQQELKVTLEKEMSKQ